MPGVLVDGNDLFAVFDATREAVDLARGAGGPTLIEALTYRHYGHSRTDPAKYRSEEEVAAWMARDPLTAARQRLVHQGVDASEIDAADSRAEAAIAAAVAAAKAAPAADPAEAFTDVWADGSFSWRT
jgi:acetoin:2,6-dichlorophenolindophenol oxidoreductase subunit alpha